MTYLSIGIIYLFEFLITISFCNRVMDKKIKYLNVLLFAFPLYAIAFALYFIFENPVLNGIMTFLICFFTMIIGYKEKIYKQIIFTVYLVIINYISEAILILFALSRYAFITLNETLNDIQLLLISLGAKTINFILVQLLVLLIRRKELNENKKIIPLFIYPFLSLCFTFQFLVLAGKYEFSRQENNAYIIFTTTNAIMCIVIFMYYSLLDEQDKKLKELEKEQQFVELNNSYMQVLETQNNDMHMIVHDVKNHYSAIANMENIEEVKEYINSISDDIQKHQIVRITDNKMLDLLLSKYKVECGNKGIAFSTEVKTANLDYVHDSDLSILICNLLDNAIESAIKSEARQITFSLRRVNNFDVLNVTNSCNIEPIIKNSKLVTSKTDKSSHGYGMKIISKYAKKNNAEYEWHFDNDKNSFNSTLIFKR